MDPATATLITTLATPIVKAAITAAGAGIAAAGAALARFLHRKTKNEDLAAATDEVFRAAGGAFAGTEVKRQKMPTQLSELDKGILITSAVKRAEVAIGAKHLSVLQKAKGKEGAAEFIKGAIEGQNLYHSSTVAPSNTE